MARERVGGGFLDDCSGQTAPNEAIDFAGCCDNNQKSDGGKYLHRPIRESDAGLPW